MPVNVITVELTNKCDLNCKFCVKKEESEIKFSTFERIVKESQEADSPIKNFELSGHSGNPFLYKRFTEVLRLLNENNCNFSILTNGFNLKWNLGLIDDSLLKNSNFSIYLDSADPSKCDFLTGVKDYYKKTIEAIEYLNVRRFRYSIFMRVNSFNYQEIETVLKIMKFYNGNLFFPIEAFPFNDENMILTDEMKEKVLNNISNLSRYGEPIRQVIQFSDVIQNCSYLRMERLFVNSQGKVSFCHFLQPLENTQMFDLEKIDFANIIRKDSLKRKDYLKKKNEELNVWEKPRRLVSPCSYCLHYFGKKKKW
jgi:MoaA/NifB/PqqE/SkfB family radical SAM enzyme